MLLVYCTGVCASQESDLVVLTTASRLREEIKSQLDETLAQYLPDFTCNCDSQNNDNTTQVRVLPDQDLANTVEELKECVANIKSVTDLLLSHLSLLLTPGYTPSHPATSCKEILQLAPQSPSGLYWIRGTDNAAKHMYCDMERSCKGVVGGWMRVASIDMTDTSSTCPSGLRTLTSPRRLCAMNTDSPGCSSAVLPVQGVQYSRVCGKIIGYQDKTPDGFWPYIHGGQRTIDSGYVDGISLTHGTSPRKHIWTFAAALHEYTVYPPAVCPCTNTRNSPPPAVPSFIGHDYFCDTGSENHFQFIFYGDDPLWDGAGCGQFSTCCSWNSPPWFLKNISPPTSDDIEMRFCTNEHRNDEDINFELLMSSDNSNSFRFVSLRKKDCDSGVSAVFDTFHASSLLAHQS